MSDSTSINNYFFHLIMGKTFLEVFTNIIGSGQDPQEQNLRGQNVMVIIYGGRKASNYLNEEARVNFENKVDQILKLLSEKGDPIWPQSQSQRMIFNPKAPVSLPAEEQVEMPVYNLPFPPPLTRTDANPIPSWGYPFYMDDGGRNYYTQNEFLLSCQEVRDEQDRLTSERNKISDALFQERFPLGSKFFRT